MLRFLVRQPFPFPNNLKQLRAYSLGAGVRLLDGRSHGLSRYFLVAVLKTSLAPNRSRNLLRSLGVVIVPILFSSSEMSFRIENPSFPYLQSKKKIMENT